MDEEVSLVTRRFVRGYVTHGFRSVFRWDGHSLFPYFLPLHLPYIKKTFLYLIVISISAPCLKKKLVPPTIVPPPSRWLSGMCNPLLVLFYVVLKIHFWCLFIVSKFEIGRLLLVYSLYSFVLKLFCLALWCVYVWIIFVDGLWISWDSSELSLFCALILVSYRPHMYSSISLNLKPLENSCGHPWIACQGEAYFPCSSPCIKISSVVLSRFVPLSVIRPCWMTSLFIWRKNLISKVTVVSKTRTQRSEAYVNPWRASMLSLIPRLSWPESMIMVFLRRTWVFIFSAYFIFSSMLVTMRTYIFFSLQKKCYPLSTRTTWRLGSRKWWSRKNL